MGVSICMCLCMHVLVYARAMCILYMCVCARVQDYLYMPLVLSKHVRTEQSAYHQVCYAQINMCMYVYMSI